MIRYQRCATCAAAWYFDRSFCPRCGAGDPVEHAARGHGVVYATTLVHRAPERELREHVPYLIVLVDMDEGFRVMGHGERGLQIGAAVSGGTVEWAARAIPFFRASQGGAG